VVCTAASNGHHEIVERLVTKWKIEIDRELDSAGRTELLLASEKGHADVVRVLLDAGANIYFRRKEDGATCLFSAARFGHEEVLALLLAFSSHPSLTNKSTRSQSFSLTSSISSSTTYTSSTSAHSKPANANLSNDEENEKNVDEEKNNDERNDPPGNDDDERRSCSLSEMLELQCTSGPYKDATPLWAAAAEGHTKTVRMLLEHGSNINVTVDGVSVLMVSEKNGRKETTRFLKTQLTVFNDDGSIDHGDVSLGFTYQKEGR